MLSVRPLVRPNQPCGRHNSATAGWIHSKSSSLELAWPVDVQRHGHLHACNLHARKIPARGSDLADTRTQQPLDRSTQNQV